MEPDNNKETNCGSVPFCRLAWIASAVEAARSYHAGQSVDELTAFGLVNPLPDQQAVS